jgi:UDP-N-acetylmuramate--alanine ligase
MNTECYHFIGIGGIGMSGLAKMLLEQKQKVSGSDIASSVLTDTLIDKGATIYIGHAKEHVPDDATVIYSSDISQDNPELVAAIDKKCRLLHRSDLLVTLMQNHSVIAIAGTHGKTTTTALLTHVLQSAGFDPSFAVGGHMHGVQTNAAFGKGMHFVAEADESDGSFLKYSYDYAIVTNIDTDHLAHFGNWETLVEAFRKFMHAKREPKLLFTCADDITLNALDMPGISYGFSEKARLRITNFSQTSFQIQYDVHFDGKVYKEVQVSLTGRHNALNSLAVFGLAVSLGVSEEACRAAFKTFSGVKRRLEKKGEKNGIVFFDDYAHHPTEIATTLQALRQALPERRLIVAFQPHRYSRMRFLLKNFAATFDDADLVVITDLYTAKETPVPQVTSEAIYEEIRRHYPTKTIFLSRVDLVEGLKAKLSPGDVLVTMGAGDITKVGPELCQGM